jgi:hypothetical protein
MKRYEVLFDEQKNEGVYALSLVNSPAIESTWVALKEQSLKFAEVDAERKLLLGIALIPDKPIYRNDENGEYELTFASQTIERVAHNFVRAGKVGSATEEHQVSLSGEQVSVVQSWIIEDDVHDKTRKFGFSKDNAPVGSWAVMMQVDDDEIYSKAKNGELKGFSIEGLFDTQLINFKTNDMNVESITKAVTDGFENLVSKFATTQEPEKPVELQEETEMPAEESDAPSEEQQIMQGLTDLFINLENALMAKLNDMEAKLLAQEQTIEAQEQKITELSKTPADNKIKSKPTSAPINAKLSLQERINLKLNQ